MSGLRFGLAVGGLGLCLMAAACSPPPPRDSGNDTGATAPATATPSPRATQSEPVAPAKSILRPEVAEPAPAAPPLRAIDAVAGFDEQGRRLTDAAKALLDDLAAAPATQASGAITLRGHSDSRGDDRANLRASRRRAETVRDYLAERGIDPARMTVIALGETTPLVPNALPDGRDDPAARRKNRRVDVHVALPAAPQAAAPADTDAPAEKEVQPRRQD